MRLRCLYKYKEEELRIRKFLFQKLESPLHTLKLG